MADAFISSKKDKRLVKHSSFVSRIEKAHPAKSLKRRRPSKKLVTDLDSLKKALPDLPDHDDLQELNKGKMRLKSLRNRPGALKRKEKLVQSEVERFQGSLARLNAIGATTTQGAGPSGHGGSSGEVQAETEARGPQGQQHANATGGRWAALRGFISATMEQNPAFVEQKTAKKKTGDE